MHGEREMVARFAFLSDEWVEAARGIRAEYAGRIPAVAFPLRMNQVVKGVPWGSGVVDAHLDTTGGHLDFETGHLEHPDLTITVDYDTAKLILVEGDGQAAMQAFLSGKIKVDGDIGKLLSLQAAGVVGAADPLSIELAQRIQDITA